MKIGICDDNKKEREHIEALCRDQGYEEILSYASGEELLLSPDLSSLSLLFLDIEMGGVGGIEIKNRLETTNPATYIVFCTSHSEMMGDAFGRNVIYFLTKPLSERSVQIVMNKATFFTKDSYRLAVNSRVSLPCENILYLHAEQKHTVFHTKDNKIISSRRSLKNWLEELGALGFCPISRSTVINLRHYVRADENMVYLHQNTAVSISRRYQPVLREKCDAYMLHVAGL